MLSLAALSLARRCSNYPNFRAGEWVASIDFPGTLADPCINSPNIPTPRRPRGLTPDSAIPADEPDNLLPRAIPNGPTLPTWCLPQSTIYITVTMTNLYLSQSQVSFLLQEAAGVIDDSIRHFGPALTTGNGFNWQEHGISLVIASSNGRQLTWGVMRHAMSAVYQFFERGNFGAAVFTIYDGLNEVGRGRIF